MKEKNNHCPYCGSLLSIITETLNEKVCNCQECNITLTFKTDKITAPINSISNHLNNTPSILLVPYQQLISLIEADEIYGALLKLKDIFELNLKLPLIIILSHIEYHLNSDIKGGSDFISKLSSLNETLQSFLNDTINFQLSFGNWETISGEIKRVPYKALFNDNNDHPYLKYLYQINANNHHNYTSIKGNGKLSTLSAWRNNTIGHGALNCDKENVKQDILEKLTILNKILQENDVLYSAFKLFMNGNTMSLIPTGSDTSYPVSPFIANELPQSENQIISEASIFDSYNCKKKTSHSINYANGLKQISAQLSETFCNLEENLEQSDFISLINSGDNKNIFENTIYQSEIEMLENLQTFKYSQGTYFSDWFINCIENFRGGVFLCCAERGLGKSAFSRAINQLTTTKIYNNDKLKKYLSENEARLLIRTFHFNSYHNSDIITFIAKLKDIVTSVLACKNNKDSYLSSIVYISHNIEESYNELYQILHDNTVSKSTIKQYFVAFLQTLHNVWRYRFSKEKLVLILDGIDEVKSTKNNISITELIPTHKELEELSSNDIYIFVTSRCPEELDKNFDVYNYICSSNFTDLTIINRKSEKYKECYIKDIQSNFAIKSIEEAANLATILEWRYNYLVSYRKIYSLDNNITFNKDPFSVYINYLNNLSSSYSQDIQNLLNLFALSTEPLTISEISYLLTGDNNPTFKLYGMLLDISDFLVLERDNSRGTLYTLSHEEWYRAIIENHTLQDNLNLLKPHLKELLINILAIDEPKDFSSTIFDGETWLLSNLNLFDINDIEPLTLIYESDWGGEAYRLYRKICYLNAYTDLFASEDLNKYTADYIHFYLNSYVYLTLTLSQLGKFSEAINIHSYICKLCSGYVNSDHNLIYKYHIAMNQYFCSNALKYLNHYEEAIVKISDAIEIFEIILPNLSKNDNWSIWGDLSRCHSDKAGILSSYYQNTEEALKHIDFAIYYCQLAIDNYVDSKTEWIIHMTELIHNKGLIYSSFDFDKALECYDNAITKLKSFIHNLNDDYIDRDANILLSKFYANKAILFYRFNKNLNYAITVYEEAVKICERLEAMYKEGSIFFDVDNLSTVYNDIAFLCTNIDYDKALKYFEKSITICEQLSYEYKNNGRFYDNAELARVYNNRALLLSKTNKAAALHDYNKAIQIFSSLSDELHNGISYFNQSNLADVFNNRAELIRDSSVDDAILDFTNAIKIHKQIVDDAKINNSAGMMDALADDYNNRACLLATKSDCISKAINDADEAIKIRETLYKNFKHGGAFFNINKLANSYCTKAMILDKTNTKLAISYINKTINIRKKLMSSFKNSEIDFDPYDLAEAYCNKGYLLSLQGNHMDAIGFLTKAIEIAEKYAYKDSSQLQFLASCYLDRANSYNKLNKKELANADILKSNNLITSNIF